MPLPPLPLPDIPEAPSRADPTTFEERNDAAVEFQFNTLPPWIEEQVTRTFTNTTESAQNAATAVAAKDAAEAAANSASQSAGATEWVSGREYAAGDAVWSPIDFQTYRRKVAGSGTTDPSLDTANWEPVGAFTPEQMGAARVDLGNVSQTDARNKVGTGTMAYRDLTISTDEPSGTVPGQVWFQIED